MVDNDLKRCLECNEVLIGRSDKKFCNPYCKSSYYYNKRIKTENKIFTEVDKILKKNRKILKQYNKAGKSTVIKSKMISEGFNPKYFTNYWRAQNKNIYFFCYEYGFMEKQENQKVKYILVTWQAYMN
jgi:hypothetical protein